MKNATSIFYVNSAGFMAQWKGQVIEKTETSISIRFSKNKAFKYDLKRNSDFCLVTKTVVKDLGVCVKSSSEAIQFDDNLKQIVLDATKNNTELYWNGKEWK